MSVKICSLNVEGDKHLDLVLNFLQVEHPDVACLQELYQADVAVIERATGMQGHFLPLVRMEQENNYGFNPRGSFGLGIFISPDAKFVGNPLSSYYFGNPANLPVFDLPNSLCRALFCVQIVKQSQKYSICTTHFTWSPAGQADEHQRRDLAGLVLAIGQLRQQLEARSAGEGGASSDGQGLLLCGDFNAPRGGEIYQGLLAAGFADWLPSEVETTLDPNLHRVPGLKLVVDYMLTTGPIRVDDMQVVGGVSDHQALVGDLGF